jgi:hypothetical protein
VCVWGGGGGSNFQKMDVRVAVFSSHDNKREARTHTPKCESVTTTSLAADDDEKRGKDTGGDRDIMP